MPIKRSDWICLLGVVLCTLLSHVELYAQVTIHEVQNDFLNKNISRLQVKKYFSVSNSNFHSAIQPYEFHSAKIDSIQHEIFKPPKFGTSIVKDDASKICVEPLLNIGTSSFEGSDISTQLIGGIRTRARLHDKLYMRASIFGGLVNSRRDSLFWSKNRILNGIAPLEPSSDGYSLLDFTGALTYLPSDVFSLQLGKGKHHYGDGYRSLILSDNALSYPYFKIRTRIWKVEYINLFSKLNSYEVQPTEDIQYGSKFSASHLLSWNINNNANIYFFESIIWQGDDSLNHRGFDVNYVNPIIFYRPVEFSIGSSDNAVAGIGGSIKIEKKLQFYGQFMIDEMIFTEFIGRSGWWGNKYGIQLGFKAFDVFKTQDTYFQMEWNQVRPFTYSHGSVRQNYAHYSQPLAHPTGSNFYEFLGLFTKKKNNLEFQLQSQYILKGNDILDQNLGGNIFNSYVDPFINYDNRLGQGITVGSLTNQAVVAYVFDQKRDGRVSLTFMNRLTSVAEVETFNNMVGFGFSLNM